MVEKDFLGAWALVDAKGAPKDYTLTIVAVKSEVLKTQEQPKGKRKVVIRFKETPKALVGNTTNCTVLEELYGPDTDRWVGQRVTLYQTMVRSPKGGQIAGIRIRTKKPTGPAESLPDVPVDEGMRAAQDAAFDRQPGEEG